MQVDELKDYLQAGMSSEVDQGEIRAGLGPD